MSGAATLIGLVLYPIIFGLPTVALLYTLPDPAFDFPQQTIEVADDRQTQISHFALAFVVVALSIASHRSPSVIGFTKVNWQIAVSLGALVSSLPLGLGGLLNRLQTSEQRLAEPLNHGSLFYRSATLVQPKCGGRSASRRCSTGFCLHLDYRGRVRNTVPDHPCRKGYGRSNFWLRGRPSFRHHEIDLRTPHFEFDCSVRGTLSLKVLGSTAQVASW
jgi:hypothetical protein